MQLFTVKGCGGPWGDYGDILLHGMAERAPSGDLLLFRTGPFIPPISNPFSDLVVTQQFRELLEPQGFTGFEFCRVSKRRIVHLEWQDWDQEAEEPQEYPETGEPEDYVLKGRHSPEISRQMGDLWELRIPETPGLQIEGGNSYDPSKYGGQDLCRGDRWGFIYVSARMKQWLEAHASRWLVFSPALPGAVR